MDDYVQRIAEIIIDIIPDNWSKIALYCVYYDGRIEINFYIKNGNDFFNAFDLVNAEELIPTILELKDIIVASREKQEWKIQTITIDEDGNFKVDFDYDSSSFDIFKWKEKYLDI